MQLREVPVDLVLPFNVLTAKEGASVKRDKGTTWFALVTDRGASRAGGPMMTVVHAFAGVWVGKNLARLKGQWTVPSERGLGHGRTLVEHTLTWAESQPVAELEVIQVRTGDPEFWPRYGFRQTGTRPNGGRVYRKSVARG